MFLLNEFEPFSKLVNSEFYNDFETFSKLVDENGNGNGNVSTNKILGSLEILAIKNVLVRAPAIGPEGCVYEPGMGSHNPRQKL